MTKRWTAAKLEKSEIFRDLVQRVHYEAARRQEVGQDRRPALAAQTSELEEQLRGWSQTLSKPNLTHQVRSRIEADFTGVQDRLESIRLEIAGLDHAIEVSQVSISAADVAERLNRVADILLNGNATRANLELSLHIDRIVGTSDGRVVVRTCQLGALAGMTSQLASSKSERPPTLLQNDGTRQTKGRQRTRLRASGTDVQGNDLVDLSHFAADVNRFAGLGSEWFTDDEFRIPGRNFWAKENATAVAARRKEGLCHMQLAEEFGVSVPTVRHALEIARKEDSSLDKLPRKMPRPRWPEECWQEVVELRNEGKTIAELCEHFGKSQPYVNKALRIAAKKLSESMSEDEFKGL